MTTDYAAVDAVDAVMMIVGMIGLIELDDDSRYVKQMRKTRTAIEAYGQEQADNAVAAYEIGLGLCHNYAPTPGYKECGDCVPCQHRIQARERLGR